MFFSCFAIHTDVIMYGYYSWCTFGRHTGTSGVQMACRVTNNIPCMCWMLLSKMMMYLSGYSEINPSHQVWKRQWHHWICGIFHPGWGLVMFPHDCFIQVTGIKTGEDGAIRFAGYAREETHSLGSVTGVIIPWSTMFLRVFFNLFCSFSWDFPVDMLNQGYGRI